MQKIFYKVFILMVLGFFCQISQGQENINLNKFRQLKQELPTPNVYRNGAGAPGHEYWQQKADYKMDISLDEEKHRIDGKENITYYNQSPDKLNYLWVQLDQNVRAKDSDTYKINSSNISNGRMYSWTLRKVLPLFDGGFNIERVQTDKGKDLKFTINQTMMRIDLEEPLNPGESFSFDIDWWYNIQDRMTFGGRSGYEHFNEDDNTLYTIAQFFPRMCVYNDVEGWQNKQFLGRGEFALPFGDYEVSITVPSDHLVAATGVLQNPDKVLTRKQRNRYEEAQKSTDKPVIIVTEEEAIEAEKEKSKKMKTWKFKAENVRDFGFASSRKFIWDAQAVKFGDRTVMAMSMYPKEGNPLWEEFSTKAIVKTLEVYSKHTFDYPYPIAYSIHAADIGMEYPMICFNFGRPDSEGNVSDRTKYGMISVIIHEVGHNYFPMIVNSDERQWTWMDEGLNTFLQYLTEKEFMDDYPSRRGPAAKIVPYMKGDKSRISPIMTNSESIHQFGSNAYGKPATALNILRETIMGPELFDYAFKEYAQRWMFKHPTPADFFRSMEDASGVDLDWFWRGWFYSNDHVDMAIESVNRYKIQTDSVITSNDGNVTLGSDGINYFNPIYAKDNEQLKTRLTVNMTDATQSILDADQNFYEITVKNIGGLVMPLIFQLDYTDGTSEIIRVPAEIWLKYHDRVTKIIPTDKEVKQILLDPNLETADTDTSNNTYPPIEEPSKFDALNRKGGSQE